MLVGSSVRQLRACRDPAALAALAGFQSDLVHVLRTGLTRPIFSTSEAVNDYLRIRQAHLSVESIRILFLDAKNGLIMDEEHDRGGIDQARLIIRRVLLRAIELDAAALLIVHNHPSGDPTPTRADILITQDLIAAARPIGLAVHDHVVVGANGSVSMRGRGLI